MLRTLLATATLALGLLAGSVSPASAQPCWRTVILDWSHDHQVDRSYPLHCYRDALRNAPEDLQMYSDLPAALSRAMQQALRLQNQTTVSARAGLTRGVASTTKKTVRSSARKAVPGPIRRALDAIGPTEARALPIPMIVLAGIALLLVATGVAGMVARRLQARRVRPGPPSS